MTDPESERAEAEAEAEAELHHAIADILGRHGLMATKWIMAVEGLGAAGARAMEAFTSPDFRAWDSIGLLGFLDARERGVIGDEAAQERRAGG